MYLEGSHVSLQQRPDQSDGFQAAVNSNNTRRLNLEETKAKIVSLQYIQDELAGIHHE